MNLSMAASTLRAFSEKRERMFATFVYLLFAGVPLLVFLLVLVFAHSSGAPRDQLTRDAFGICGIISIGNWIVWLYYARNGINLTREARALQMPSVARAVLSALALLFITTVVVPTALLSWFGGGNFIALLGVLASAAFAGLLIAMIKINTGPWYAMMFLLAGAVSANHYHLETMVPFLNSVSFPHPGNPGFTVMVSLIALLLGLLCARRWGQLQRQERGLAWASMRRIINMPDARTDNWASHASVLRAYVEARVNLEGLGPQRPVAAMGAFLGSPFLPLSWRQTFVTMSIRFGWLALNALFLAFALSTKIILPWLGFIALLFLASYASTIRHLFQRRAGELAELALMPGWGDAERARHLLLSAVFRPQSTMFLLCFMTIMLSAVFLRMPSAAYVAIAGMAIGVGSAFIAFNMRALANMKSTRAIVLLIFFMMLIAVVTIFREHNFVTMMQIGVCWLGLTAVMGWLALHAYHRFTKRPHPFLTS